MKFLPNTPIEVAKLFLRIGLAFVFSFAAIYIALHPEDYIKYVPSLVQDTIGTDMFFRMFGLYEIVLSVTLLSGRWSFYVAILAALTMLAITFPNITEFKVLFRNVAIVYAGLALAALSWDKK